MQYRGKSYTVVRGHSPDIWKWQVELDGKNVKSGEAKTLAAAETSARWLIDKALARKKTTPNPPNDDHSPY